MTSTLRRSASSSSVSSSGSSDSPISYVSATPATKSDGSGVKVEKLKTRQKVDRRAPSTFWKKSVWDMTLFEKLCYLAQVPAELHEIKDEDFDRGPVPRQSVIRENLFILSRAFLHLGIQGAWYYAFPNYHWPTWFAYLFYVTTFSGFAIRVLRRLNHYCVEYGVLDEKNVGRDETPDNGVDGLARGVIGFIFIRIAFNFYLHWDKHENPLTAFTWTYPLRLVAWQLTLDYVFYAYHRSCHEVDFLWKIHQKHHQTKRPTPLLSILADDFQESLEIFALPFLTSVLVPMSFSELYLTLCYTLYVEMLGHSGVRAYWAQPSLFWLRMFDCEGIVEDHDLHHRYGKSGKNYGKQSRIWDQLFGTVSERIETKGM